MANLVLGLDAVNFSAVASWRTCGTVTGQPQIAGLNFSMLGTTPAYSSTWTNDSGTYDGVLIEIDNRSASPSGTITLVIRKTDNPGSGDVATVTINVADLPQTGGWVFFKLASSVTLLSAGDYAIGLSTSVTNQVGARRNATANNWNRLLRQTTSPASLAAGDRFWICGEKTGAGAQNTRKAFIDTTAGVDYGPIDVGSGGTLESLTAASTNYILRTTGVLTISQGGTLNMGTSGTRMPSTSSCEIQLGAASGGADGTAGIVCNGTWNAYGATRTFDRTKLAADEIVGSTSLDVDDNTGWVSGDLVAIAATVRTSALTQECEARTLTGAGTTILPVAATSYAHQGTDEVKAEVVLLTRNVRVRATQQANHTTQPGSGVSIAVVGYVQLRATAVVNASWASFADLGEGTVTVAGKRGVEIQTTTGSASFDRCSFYSFEDGGLYLYGPAVANVSITNCVTFNLAALSLCSLYVPQTTGSAIVITGNIFLQRQSTSTGPVNNVKLEDYGITFDNNTMVGGYHGVHMARTNNPAAPIFSGNVFHNQRQSGIFFGVNGGTSAGQQITFANTIVYRSGAAAGAGGIMINASQTNLAFNGTGLAGGKGLIVFGCWDNIRIWGTAVGVGGLLVENGAIDGDSKTGGGTSDAGLSILDSVRVGIRFLNSTFGTSPASGGKTTHSVADIEVAFLSYVQALFENCAFRSSTEVAGDANMLPGSHIKIQRRDQTNAQHKTHFPYGTVELDSVTAPRSGGALPTEKLAPNSTSRLESSPIAIAVQSGQVVIPKVWVKKAGANPTQSTRPRIVLKKNPALGVNADTVIGLEEEVDDTTWQILNTVGAATPAASDDGVFEFVVDSGNQNGIVNCDDWAFT